MAAPVTQAADAAAAADGDTDQDKENRLREQVYSQIMSSNVLSSVKAHLRARLYAELKGGGSRASAVAGLRRPGGHSPTLHQHVLNCLMAEYLLAQQYKYSLSVFLAETGSDALPQLSHADILRLVGVLPESKVHALLMAACSSRSPASGHAVSTSPGMPSVGPGAVAVHGSGGAENSSCLAEGMVAVLGSLGAHISTHDACSQTCGHHGCGTTSDGGNSPAGPSSGSAVAPSQLLMQRLQQIEEDYQRRSGQLEQAAAASLEERMAAYQRECDARCAAQLAEQLSRLRSGELEAVREQETARFRQQLVAEQQALQQALQERLAKLSQQEEELLERGRRLQREHNELREEHLRRLRSEEERLHAWKAEQELQLSAAEAAARQQQQRAEQAQRQAELQLQEGEQRVQAKLGEAAQREAAAAQQAAAGEAQLSQVAQLQRQLAAALEEQGSLRQQLAAARATHQAEQAAWRQEVEAVRQENAQLAAATSAAQAGPAGLTAEDSARLQQAVRRLMQRVEGLQGEVEACRERERLWKSTAAEADKLLGKSAKSHDHALQHAEELRLALSAATREVADLQQAAAMAAAGMEGPLAATLQAVSRDAQRWREGAEAKLSAAQQQEEQLRREAAQLRQCALSNRTAAAQGLQQLLASYMQGRQQAAGGGRDSSDELSLQAVSAAAPTMGKAAGQPAAARVHVDSYRAPGPEHQAPQSLPVQPVMQQAWQAQDPQPSMEPWPPQQLQQRMAAFDSGTAALTTAASPPWQSQQQQQPSPCLPPSVAAGNQQQQVTTAKPASRTAADILAAYRARQQQAAGPGPATAVLGSQADPSPSSSSRSQKTSDASASEEEEDSSSSPRPRSVSTAVQRQLPQDEPSEQHQHPAMAGTPAAGAPGGGAEGGDSYYCSDFTSEDSRF